MSETKNILVAESNPVDVSLLSRVLGDLRLFGDCMFVNDGQEVLDYLDGTGRYANRRAFPYPDIVLLDFFLLKLNGVQVLELIRANPAHAGLFVFMWSDAELIREFNRAKNLGAQAVMKRPLKTAVLKDLLRGLLKIVTPARYERRPAITRC